jgi:hypothetical protein
MLGCRRGGGGSAFASSSVSSALRASSRFKGNRSGNQLGLSNGTTQTVLGFADCQRKLAVSLEKIGAGLVAQGDLSEALKSYSSSLGKRDV